MTGKWCGVWLFMVALSLGSGVCHAQPGPPGGAEPETPAAQSAPVSFADLIPKMRIWLCGSGPANST